MAWQLRSCIDIVCCNLCAFSLGVSVHTFSSAGILLRGVTWYCVWIVVEGAYLAYVEKVQSVIALRGSCLPGGRVWRDENTEVEEEYQFLDYLNFVERGVGGGDA